MGSIREAVGRTVHRIAESVLPTPLGGGDLDEENVGYRRLGKRSKRDLEPLSHDKQREVAWYLWLSNPVGKDIVEKMVDFIIGEGVSAVAKEEEVQQIIDRFWDDDINNIEVRAEAFTREVFLFGELCLPTAVTEVNGAVTLGYMDVSEIDSVAKDPDNALIDDKVGRKKDSTDVEWLDIIKKDRDPNNETFGYLTGDVFYFAVNRVSNGTRGNSEMLHIADWCDAYDQYLFNHLENSELSNMFIWDVELRGMSPKEIKQWIKDNKNPKAGGLRAHNEQVKWNQVSPGIRANEATHNARLFRGQIGMGAGIPEHWMGFTENTNKAGATESNEPPIKRMTRRQKMIKRMLAFLVDYAIDQAIVAGYLKLPKDEKEAAEFRKFEIQMPDMSTKDVSRVAGAMAQMVTAMLIAEQQGWTTSDKNIELFASLCQQAGLEVDVDELKKLLKKETEKREEVDDESQFPGDTEEFEPDTAAFLADNGG